MSEKCPIQHLNNEGKIDIYTQKSGTSSFNRVFLIWSVTHTLAGSLWKITMRLLLTLAGHSYTPTYLSRARYRSVYPTEGNKSLDEASHFKVTHLDTCILL